MRVLFTTQPGHGSFQPLGSVAGELIGAGHEGQTPYPARAASGCATRLEKRGREVTLAFSPRSLTGSKQMHWSTSTGAQ